jgi:hypothetical protein
VLEDSESSNAKFGPSFTGVERRYAPAETPVVIGTIAWQFLYANARGMTGVVLTIDAAQACASHGAVEPG